MDTFVNRYMGDEEREKPSQKDKLIVELRKKAREKAKSLKRKNALADESMGESAPKLPKQAKTEGKVVSKILNGDIHKAPKTFSDNRKYQKRKSRRKLAQRRKNKAKVKTVEVKKTIERKKKEPIATEVEGFTVIGEQKRTRKVKVHRVLPDWLAHPTVVSIDLQKDKVPLSEVRGLDDIILQNLAKKDVTHFFPVQQAVIPWQLDNVRKRFYRPRDLCVCSPTGSGKTLAFVLPIVQALKDRIVCTIRAVVVLPVVELALQVFEVFNTYVKRTDLKVGLAVGHTSLEKEQKNLVCNRMQGYESLVDILVTTPGRLVDHLQLTKGFSLDCLQFLVIDEADRMIYEIKHDWFALLMQFISKPSKMHPCSLWPLNSSSPVDRSLMPLTAENCHRMKLLPQKMLFSATLSHDPEILHQLKLFKPHLCTAIVPNEKKINSNNVKSTDQEVHGDYIGKFITPKELQEFYIIVDVAAKPLLLVYLILKLKYKSILCFTNSIQDAHRLHLLLASFKEITVREVSSLQSAQVKKATLKEFAEGSVDIVFCTDAIARGMDIQNVHYVISYEAPKHMESYVHRVGRTARAGAQGTAITLLESHEVFKFLASNKKCRKEKIKRMRYDDSIPTEWETKYKSALDNLSNVIQAEKKRAKLRR